MKQTSTNQQFDYIVVGAGSAGAALAARLSENPNNQVCLLEAGKKDKNPLIHIPFGLALIAKIEGKIGWAYNTEPQTAMQNRSLYWPRGKVLGGSSSINAMCYIRGDHKDYDSWQAQGAEGWDWNSVLPYFKKSEDNQRGADGLHGVGGPLGVSDLGYKDTLSKTFVSAAREVDLPILADFNQSDRFGLGFYQVTQRGGQRCSSAKGYLSEARYRSNLTIITEAHTEKVKIKHKRAVGVLVRIAGELVSLHARKEVLLCGGAINSPKLLMLSGVGPADHLAEHGIAVQADSPGVGQNLQDHLDAIVQYRCEARQGYAVAFSAVPKFAAATFKYWLKRQGIFTSNVSEAGGFAKSQYAEDIPDLQYHFLPAILHDHGRKTVMGYGFGLHVCGLYPKSRGEIRLKSSHPDDAPLIDPQYLTDEADQNVMIDGVKQARKILASSAFEAYRGIEISPGPEVQSDEQILQFIRSKGETIYHPIGTCKMGPVDDPMTVVDPELNVKGIKGLRVVDASVMPTLVGGNTNAPTIMIAEKAADMILAADSVD